MGITTERRKPVFKNIKQQATTINSAAGVWTELQQ